MPLNQCVLIAEAPLYMDFIYLRPSKVMLVKESEYGPCPWLVSAATDTVYSVNGVSSRESGTCYI